MGWESVTCRMRLWRRVAAVLTLALLAGYPQAGRADAAITRQGFADLTARLLPAVVNISTTATVKPDNDATPDLPQFPPGSPFEQFFKNFMKHGTPARPQKETALGSGFIIDPAGLIVTNNHVIADAESITVILQDNTSAKAVVVGHDPLTDLALLRIKPPHRLVAVHFGDSDAVKVGDWVVAVGNPYGLGGTVTAGILSARARAISDDGPYDDFLQTDAAINKGNSGGPLFDLKGDVIGIDSAILSPSGGSVGIGFAIPANLARHVIGQFERFGKVRRGWIGVRLQSVNPDIAAAFGLAKPEGAVIGALVAGSPAEAAGLHQGDVILSVAGETVRDMRDVERRIGDAEIGRSLALGLWRKSAAQTVEVTVIEHDTPPAVESGDQAAAGGAAARPETAHLLGLSLSTPTQALKDKYQLGDAAAVIVVDVARQGPAAGLDLKPGDVIVEAAEAEVERPKDVAAEVAALRKAGRKTLLLLVDRGGDLHFVTLRVDRG